MHITIFSFHKPYPPNHGVARRVWGLASSLVQLGQETTVFYTGKGQAANIDGVRLHGVPRTGALENRLFDAVFVRYHNNIDFYRMFRRLGLDRTTDVLQYEFPYLFPTAALARRHGVPIVLDAHGVEAAFNREVHIENSPSVAMLKKSEFTEWLSLRFSDRVFACSKADAGKMHEIYGTDLRKIAVVPNGVAQSFFEPIEPHEFHKPTALFVGSALHPPNKYAIELLASTIIPRVLKSRKDAQFAFIGKHAKPPYPWWMSTPPPKLAGRRGVLDLAEVSAVEPYMAGADVCVAPIYQGSGTRTKILEYLACGKAVVTTGKGIEGIEVMDGRELLIRDEPDEFADAVSELLGSPKKARRLGAAGRRFVKGRYDWPSIAKRTIPVYEELARR